MTVHIRNIAGQHSVVLTSKIVSCLTPVDFNSFVCLLKSKLLTLDNHVIFVCLFFIILHKPFNIVFIQLSKYILYKFNNTYARHCKEESCKT